MIRPSPYFERRAPLAALSHCPDCDLWLREDESCLHMPRRIGARRPAADASCASAVLLSHGSGM